MWTQIKSIGGRLERFNPLLSPLLNPLLAPYLQQLASSLEAEMDLLVASASERWLAQRSPGARDLVAERDRDLPEPIELVQAGVALEVLSHIGRGVDELSLRRRERGALARAAGVAEHDRQSGLTAA